MVKDFEITNISDGEITVIIHPDCKISKTDIVDLLVACGFPEENIIFLGLEELEKLQRDQTVIVPIDAGTRDNNELGDVAQRCANNGNPVVVVLGSGFSLEGIHPIAEKYGTQSGWSAETLTTCLTQPVTAVPTDSTGAEIKHGEKGQVSC